jgi:UDP-N-acetylglucosamine 1-carboxyvinyltransferase
MMTGGEVTAKKTEASLMQSVLKKFEEMGAQVTVGSDWINVKMVGRPKAVDIRTLPHPAFPTDMQAQLMTVCCIAEGTSTIIENIFENRYMHVPELQRMGANIKVDGHTAVVQGVDKLNAAPVIATDLRASMSLVMAAVAAQGETCIERIYHIDRGYEYVEDKLRGLGVTIERVKGE